jgi:pyruvate dehydrogenase E2 component (dihydrolipoyllysine-residue acetyltransferase)
VRAGARRDAALQVVALAGRREPGHEALHAHWLRDADKKDLYEIAKSLAALSERARTGKLQSDDIQGGVFTISSLGGIGGRYFTPIINAPEVAILGVSRSKWQPVYRELSFVPRLMLPLSLSYDHRVIDGAKAVRFTTRLGELLANPGQLVEAIP